MKSVMPFAAGVGILLLTALTPTLKAESHPPGQVDFGTFSPPQSGGEFVEVNLTSSLISIAARFVEREDADLAQLLSGLQLVRVNVVGLDDQNRSAIEKRITDVPGKCGAPSQSHCPKQMQGFVFNQAKRQDMP